MLATAIAALAALALCSGCAEQWTPDAYPVEVAVLSDVSAAERDAVIGAAAAWNGRLGEPVFTVRFAPGEPAKCGRINVAFTDRMAKASSMGEADIEGWRQCQATIRVRPDQPRRDLGKTVAHELGHVVTGPEHSDDPRSVMFPDLQAGAQAITDEDVELVRHAIEATR